MARDLTEASAVILGGTLGIGFASAKKLLKSGLHKLTICALDPTSGRNCLTKLASEFPGAYLHFVQCDPSDPQRAESAITHAQLAMGRIDMLVNCGSTELISEPLHELQADALLPSISSLMGCLLHPVHVVYPVMMKQKSGSIVCLSTDAALIPAQNNPLLATAMAGVNMFCRAMAAQAQLHNIRVNCVSVGAVSGTTIYDSLIKDPSTMHLLHQTSETESVGAVKAEDVAEVVAFLAGPDSAKITGEIIGVKGEETSF